MHTSIDTYIAYTYICVYIGVYTYIHRVAPVFCTKPACHGRIWACLRDTGLHAVTIQGYQALKTRRPDEKVVVGDFLSSHSSLGRLQAYDRFR